jgi:hypothetical protein
MNTELNFMLADLRRQEILQRAERDNELQRALRGADYALAREVRAARFAMLRQNIRRRLNGLRPARKPSAAEIASGKLELVTE